MSCDSDSRAVAVAPLRGQNKMRYRSWLVVPGESEKKLAKAVASGADVIVIDLDGPLSASARDEARRRTAEWLGVHRQHVTGGVPTGRWVRISALDSRLWRDDLIAVMKGMPDGIILPRASGPDAVQHLASEIYELEGGNHIRSGSTRIMPVVSGSAEGALAFPAYLAASAPRLAGLMWDAPALASAIGATRSREGKTGPWVGAFAHVRAQTLLTAHARGWLAIDTAYPDVADGKGLKTAVQASRGDGFSGMIALHPGQLAEINTAFQPSEEELAQARSIASAFGENVESGGETIDRRMVNQAQVKLARRLLGLDMQRPPEPPRQTVMRTA